MKINFSVVSFVPSSAQVAVVGSVPELGSWNVDKCVQLEPSERPQSDMAPSFWYASLKVEGAKSIEYKFIRRRSQDVGWEWEGSGSGDNRKVDLVQEGEDVVQAASFGSILKGAQGKGGSEKVLAIPVTQFLDPAGVSEYSHTTRFYMNVKNQNSIHYNKIIEAMYVGTCPRCVEHLDMLKRDLGVTALFNLQTEEDALNNYPDPKSHPTMEGRTTDHVEEVAKRRGLAYVWMPTTDMSTQARARMLPQAALVMYGLLAGGHVVYCHCNAGVGRSIAAACGYLCYVQGMSVRETQLLVSSRRPVAFFDEVALRQGKRDWEMKFSSFLDKQKETVKRAPALSIERAQVEGS